MDQAVKCQCDREISKELLIKKKSELFFGSSLEVADTQP